MSINAIVMFEEYNSRQRKIYNDYKSNSSDSLFEIVRDTETYLPEVIDVVSDILIDRKAMLPKAKPESSEVEVESEIMTKSKESNHVPSDSDLIKDQDKIKSFIQKFREKPVEDLTAIITRYISYLPETVEAALIVLVDKGLISYELKELLLNQIAANFLLHSKHFKLSKWEKNNAFVRYLEGYNDEEIYDLIENPSDIVIDVYFAILLTARNRELISEDDFDRCDNDVKKSARSEREIRNSEINDVFGFGDTSDEFASEAELEAEKEKYWKCPSCGELVEMEFSVCWKCQTSIPDKIEHPATDEILKQKGGEIVFTPIKSGFITLSLGAVICLLTIARGYSFDDFWHFRYLHFLLGIAAVLAGIGLVVYGLFFRKDIKS